MKLDKIEEIGLVELTESEKENVEGGFIGAIIAAAAGVVTVGATIGLVALGAGYIYGKIEQLLN